MEERPIECGGCKHPANVVYREIQEGKILSHCMCSKCPVLQKKIGQPAQNESDVRLISLSCNHCQTTAEMIQMGEGIGCPLCYDVFEELFIKELVDMNCMPIDPKSLAAKEKNISLHLGKTPESLENNSISKQIESLNIALGEALALENYERAASIRDQINALLGNSNGK